MATVFKCWWQNHFGNDFPLMLVTFWMWRNVHQHLKVSANKSSNNLLLFRYQHGCNHHSSPTSGSTKHRITGVRCSIVRAVRQSLKIFDAPWRSISRGHSMPSKRFSCCPNCRTDSISHWVKLCSLPPFSISIWIVVIMALRSPCSVVEWPILAHSVSKTDEQNSQ